MSKITTSRLKALKKEKQPITMVTAYDYPTAKLVDQAGVEVILVGDSLGMVVLGYDSTIPVTVADMLHHTKAVTRATTKAMVVTDLPFLSYHGSFDRTLEACATLMQDGKAEAVKLEGGSEMVETIKRLTSAGIPVMGHIGLTPQSVHQLGGYKVQGKDLASAKKLLEDAQALQEAGIFALVMECIPATLAKKISEQLDIPTIGIGAGADCDGQVLVFHDLVGFGNEIKPKFVKQYTNIGEQITRAVHSYTEEIKAKTFPAQEHSFTMKNEVLDRLYGGKAESRS
jgi:3-methyl-2-oxobutanoate hydroxymethyltransferase